MKKEQLFCPHCGSGITTKEIEGRSRRICTSCETVFYENPLPVASCIVVDEKRNILLVKRKNDPYRGEWCLPMGFAESGEKVEEAALRELEEEAGVTGGIISLVDVDTVDNYFYGPLVIVAYEVRRTGGPLQAGDDAIEASYFPISKIPKLAWESNTRAVTIYTERYRHLWNLADSVKLYLPEYEKKLPLDTDLHLDLLTRLLKEMIEKHHEEISGLWLQEITSTMKELVNHTEGLRRLQQNIFKSILFWLNRKSDTLGLEEFIENGIALAGDQLPLPLLLQAMALSRKAIWMQVVRKQILSSVLDIYATLEINNRIIYFYDRIQYFLVLGYESFRIDT